MQCPRGNKAAEVPGGSGSAQSTSRTPRRINEKTASSVKPQIVISVLGRKLISIKIKYYTRDELHSHARVLILPVGSCAVGELQFHYSQTTTSLPESSLQSAEDQWFNFSPRLRNEKRHCGNLDV